MRILPSIDSNTQLITLIYISRHYGFVILRQPKFLDLI